MHRLGVYRVRTSKQIFSRIPGSRSLRWAVTDGGGDGDGEGRFTRFVSRTLINQSNDCQRTYIERTTLKEPVNHPLTEIVGLGVQKAALLRVMETLKRLLEALEAPGLPLDRTSGSRGSR